MKHLLFLMMLTFTWAVQANNDAPMECTKYPTSTNRSWVSASVESLSHMDLRLNLVIDIDSEDQYIRVFGGKNNEADLAKACGTTKNVKLSWIDPTRATHYVGGLSSTFSAAYKICLFSIHGEVINSVEVCSWEAGD